MKINKQLLAIFFIALLARFSYVFLFPQLPLAGDAVEYDRTGWYIAEGEGFPVESSDFLAEPLRAPGYPLTLAFIYKIFGHNLQAVRSLQAIVSSFACIFIYFLAMRLFNNHTIGIISSTVCALYFPFISYSGIVSREAILAVLLLINILLVLKAFKAGAFSNYVLAGASIGISALFDERMTYFPVFVFFILLLLQVNSKKKVFIKPLFLFFSAAIVIMPWTIRNYAVYKEFIPVTRAQTACFWLSTHPSETLEWRLEKEPLKSLAAGLSNEEIFTKLSSEAVKNLKEHPFIYAKLSVKRFFRLWIGSHSNSFYGLEESFANVSREGKWGVFGVKTAMLLLNLIIITSGCVGIFIAARTYDKRAILIILLPVLYLTIVHTLSFSTPRYAVPMMPLLIVFSGITLYGMSNIALSKS